MIKKFYYVNGQIFENSENRANAKGKALRYCKENNIDKNEIYELSNNSELAYLQDLLKRDDIMCIKSHDHFELVEAKENANGDQNPPYVLPISFSFRYKSTAKPHYVAIINSVYELTKDFINSKILFDYLNHPIYYLQVLYLDSDGLWKEWHIGDLTLSIQEKKERQKKYNAQMKAIRDRQKYDRLLKMRSLGTITERQSKELYRLEKVFGGSNG